MQNEGTSKAQRMIKWKKVRLSVCVCVCVSACVCERLSKRHKMAKTKKNRRCWLFSIHNTVIVIISVQFTIVICLLIRLCSAFCFVFLLCVNALYTIQFVFVFISSLVLSILWIWFKLSFPWQLISMRCNYIASHFKRTILSTFSTYS